MQTSNRYLASLAMAIAGSALLAACAGQSSSSHSSGPASGELSGVVRSASGPEAGVWVIAETTGLPTRFTKIVVTDDRGRYLMPDLPQATYRVWVRGYGLVDSPKVEARPGSTLDLRAVPASSTAAAAQYYPAIYWYSLLKVPGKEEFPIGKVRQQGEWLNIVKSNACIACHALGTPGTRTMPAAFAHMKPAEAWARRVQSGQAMAQMARDVNRFGSPRVFDYFADWTERVKAGELPSDKPQRPQGIERNLVLTLWDWSHPTDYMHDLIGTDRRRPTLFPNGKLYGSPEDSSDRIPVLDPVTHQVTELVHPVRDPNTPSSKANPMQPSAHWGDQPIWDSKTSIHNPMMDEQGRVWFTARVRHPDNPAVCKEGSGHPSAQRFPIQRAARHLSMYDPKTARWTLISTCFPTHHLIFAEDRDHTLWLSSGGGGVGVVGWFNRRIYEQTGDEAKAQGWTPFVLDTNGNGRRDEYTEPGEPLDPSKDRRAATNLYAIAVNPVDGSVWGTALAFPFPGYVIRVAPGANPTETALTEMYAPPAPGYGPRGGDIDRNGVYWVSLSSGHLGSFDRRKCKGPLNGPQATGNHCPEGWTLYPLPGPQFKNLKEPGSAEASYYTWVDQFNTLGLGENVPIVTGNLNESYFALVNGRFVTLRVPYPMGFFAKWAEGRIDDPNGGWKGRSLWATNSTRTPYHNEGGKENKPKVVRFQMRPHPLAR